MKKIFASLKNFFSKGRDDSFAKNLNLRSKFVVGVPLLILIWLIFFSLFLYVTVNKINTHRSFDDFVYTGWGDKTRTNLLLVGTDIDEHQGTEFVEFLAVLILDKELEEIKILNINTKFSPYYISDSDNLTFKNILASEEGIGDKTGVKLLINRVEYFSAGRIDGYVKVSKEGFASIFKTWGDIKITAPADVDDPDLSFDIQKGENTVKFADFIDFVGAEYSGENDRQRRQLSALDALMFDSSLFNIILGFDRTVDSINEHVDSNLAGLDFLRIVSFLRQKDLTIKVGYIKSHPGYVITSGYGELWRPIYENVDDDIRDVFTNQNAKIEQRKIDVLNASERSGLAGSRSRWLVTRGLRVVLSGNQSKKEAITKLYVEDLEVSEWTVYEIVNSLRGEVEIIEGVYPGRSIGDIVLVLGVSEVGD